MTKYFEKTVTRMNENLNNTLAWMKGEKELGLKNSLFICEDGVLTQYVDSEEGEKFHEMVKNLTEEEFDEICDNFFIAIENKNLANMHKALAIFDELDNYPKLVKENMLRRLRRIRELTHTEAYKFAGNGEKNFIIYKGEIWKK